MQRRESADSLAPILMLARDFYHVKTILKNLEMDLNRKCTSAD